MKVLLINPPINDFDFKRAANFPLGLAYIANVFKKQKCHVKILDILAEGLNREEVEKFIKNNRFDIIGITGLVSVFSYLAWLSEIIKKYHPQTLLLFGGSLATSTPKVILENSKIDFLVLGEGELTIKDLIELKKRNKNIKQIEGIAYKESNSEIVINNNRKRIQDLDSISFPAWELFNIQKYINTNPPLLDYKWRYKKRWINIISSRGCPYGCIFCGKTFGRVTRLRSANNILLEIKQLIKKYNIEHLNFCDDFFAVDRERVVKICEGIINLDKKITWTASVRVDSIDNDLLKIMKKANCMGFCLGIESGSQRILDNIHKFTKVEIAERAVKLTKKNKLFPHCSIMIGAPEENKESIEETKNFLKKLDIFPLPINFITPVPGSELYNYAKEKGLIKNEVKYLRELDSAFFQKLAVNLTDLSEEKLFYLKRKAEREVRIRYITRHPLWAAKRLFFHFVYYGMKTSIKKLKLSILQK